LNCAQNSPDSQFVFAFGGESSNEPLVWDIRESKNVRDRFYPRMNIEFTKEELEEDVKKDDEDEDGEIKKKKRMKIFKDDKKSLKKLRKNEKKPKKARKNDYKNKSIS
jgi:hypothetical protein